MSLGNNKRVHLGRPHVECAIDQLATIAQDRDRAPGTRMAAACALLDLAHGRLIHRPRVGTGGTAPPVVRITWGEPKT